MNLLYAVLTSIILSLNLSGDVPYSAIESGFEKNNAKALVAQGKSKIIIKILGKEGVYSQQQAALVLGDFFKKYSGSSFDYMFKGKESSDGTFAIGNYSGGGQKFRVTIHFNKVGADFKIESLTIEEQ